MMPTDEELREALEEAVPLALEHIDREGHLHGVAWLASYFEGLGRFTETEDAQDLADRTLAGR